MVRPDEMNKEIETRSAPVTPIRDKPPPQKSISCPPSQVNSPSLFNKNSNHLWLCTTPVSSNSISPIRKVIELTKLNSFDQDDWLPITESRNGNAYYAAFHTLCSAIGVQVLLLPLAFTLLGWAWGIISMVIIFAWQLYTLWLLIQLHESSKTGVRYNRYLQLCFAAFGKRLGKLLGLFPFYNLSAGTCSIMIIIGGSSMKQFVNIICGITCRNENPLTTVEWYLVFTSAAVVLSQLPNLNSIAGVSLIGAITVVMYCTMIWVVSFVKGRLVGVSYDPVKANTEIGNVFGVLKAIGIIALAFRGHNLVLEIQATMPSSEKYPSHVPMWRGVKLAYLLVAACAFPLAICGYWIYGHKIPANGGLLTALYMFHSQDVSSLVIGIITLLVIINALTSYQIYGMVLYDELESKYTTRKKKKCPWWLRLLIRVGSGYFNLLVVVAIPFVADLAGLLGGITLPITLAYPCFMWVIINKPDVNSAMLWLNCGLGILGTVLSGAVVAAAVYEMINPGIKVSFFNPH